MTSSGTYNFSLANADICMEAFSRVEIRPPAITGPHMIEARRSLNLELQRWSNLQVNLWKVDLYTFDITQGIPTYTLPPETVGLLDVYLRQFTLAGTFNVTPNFSVISGQTGVTVVISNHGLLPLSWINIATPITIGGLVLQGYYQVATVTNPNTFTFTSPVAATSTVSNGGAVPLFTAVAGQVAIQVTLTNHGLVAGETFNVFANTSVGGAILLGPYIVTGVIDANNFGIAVSQTISFNDSQYENGGLAQIQFQKQGSGTIDLIMTPLGRTDYAQIPDKLVQGRPTSYWLDRLIVPQISLWQTPDQNGPYQICAYRMVRIQDASPTMGQTPDIPYRFIDALCGQLALRLAMKYAKQMIEIIKPDADRSWQEAQIEDRERADIMILPDLQSYWRN